MSELSQARLVPGRECGDCQVCCVTPTIDRPEIQKISGSRCRHRGAGGCDIYEARPPVCQSFYCAWRRMAELPENWRPDKSGIFAEIEIRVAPPFKPLGLSLMLVGDPLEIVQRTDFIDFIAGAIAGGVAIFLALPGPKGRQGVRLRLNNREVAEAIATQSRTKVKAALENTLPQLTGHDCPPIVMTNHGNDVST